MRAGDTTLQGLLGGSDQYVIPVFQRYYAWTKEDWKRLWDNLIELQEPDQVGHTHFLGSLVFVPEKHYPNIIPAFQVIDGQQRLTTLSLLLCALRDIAAARGFDMLAAEITNTSLVHQYKKGREHFRVYPRQRDRDHYITAIKQTGQASGQIGAALTYFSNQIATIPDANTEAGLRAFYEILQARLKFVHITLEGDNPYRIFKSLNSTGVELGEGDLIRNFVFMYVKPEEQDDFDDEHWKPLEEYFEGAEGKINSNLLSGFFRDFMMCAGRYIPPESTFQEFEKHYETTHFVPTDLTKELRRYADFYDIIRGVASHPDPAAHAALTRLRQLESSTTYPLVLNLMDRSKRGLLSVPDFARAVDLLASFILRRFICGESSRAYGRWFVSACTNLDPDPLKGLHGFLVTKGFPRDARFKASFIHANLYGSRYNRSVLETLERAHPHRERADLSLATIEHIMPQTLTDEWRDDLGPDTDRIHTEWLHTAGNLTLSAYNPELQNKPFDTKQQEYRNSNIILTRQLADLATWTETDIKDRGERLAELAATIWVDPNL